MSAEHNKAIFMRFMDEVGKGNLEVVDEVFSPDFVAHFPQYPDWPRGLKGARKMLEGAGDVRIGKPRSKTWSQGKIRL